MLVKQTLPTKGLSTYGIQRLFAVFMPSFVECKLETLERLLLAVSGH
jgi:hypothetical protein